MKQYTTESGAVYRVDHDNMRAMRQPDSTTPAMRHDGDWFEFSAILAGHDTEIGWEDRDPVLGDHMLFLVVNHPSWTWRSTTGIVDIREVTAEEPNVTNPVTMGNSDVV